MSFTPQRRQLATVFGIALALVLLTRLPLMPSYLYSFDSANLAFALDDFDPSRNQPQPPGYPLFVVEARMLDWLLGSPERTFAALGILISGLSLGMLFLLGKRMFSTGIGLIAAGLLLVNPPFWFAGLTSALRLHLALVSILVAYCCWRAWSGEPRYFLVASIVFGLGGGFRPELALVLLPLWGWTGWRIQKPRLMLQGIALYVGGTLVWMTVLVIGSGGFAPAVVTFSNYLSSQMLQTSPLFGAPEAGVRRMVGRAIVWNALGAACWLWALPWAWRARQGFQEWKRSFAFLALWFVPPFLFNLLVHIGVGDPDQALASIPALCLAGGFCLVAAERALTLRWLPDLSPGMVASWIVLLGNLPLFFGEFLPYQREPTTGFRGLASVMDAARVGAYESSYPRVRWVNTMTELGMKRIEQLKSGSDRPFLLIWSRDGEPVWRKVSYYFPADKIYVLDEEGDPGVLVTLARSWTGKKAQDRYSGTAPIRLPVPKGGRLVWLVSGTAMENLQQVIPVQRAVPVYYSDLPPDAAPFRWGSFEFVPE